jgi:V8-like Glu-specific endopeptidase
VAPDVVLTAGHCRDAVQEDLDSAYDLFFVRGADVFDEKEGFTEVVDIVAHPEWGTGESFHADIGIAKLAGAVPVTPMTWTADPVDDGWIGRVVTLAGYGTVDLDDNGSGYKRTGTMTVLDWDDDVVLLGADAAGQALCPGDSGSPILLERDGTWVIVGVTSYGSVAPDEGYPCGHFNGATRLDVWDAWIRDQLVEPEDTDVPDRDEPEDSASAEVARGCGCSTRGPSSLAITLAAFAAAASRASSRRPRSWRCPSRATA